VYSDETPPVKAVVLGAAAETANTQEGVHQQFHCQDIEEHEQQLCTEAHPFWPCNWMEEGTYIMTWALSLLPCQTLGCKMKVHHQCQQKWEEIHRVEETKNVEWSFWEHYEQCLLDGKLEQAVVVNIAR
jgi:hypothetical protein